MGTWLAKYNFYRRQDRLFQQVPQNGMCYVQVTKEL